MPPKLLANPVDEDRTESSKKIDCALYYLRSGKTMGGDGGPSRDSKIRWRAPRAALDQGIFIATPDFSRDANDYVSKIRSKIVLIDGSRLPELMVCG
jgi:hypothetical protein